MTSSALSQDYRTGETGVIYFFNPSVNTVLFTESSVLEICFAWRFIYVVRIWNEMDSNE